MHRAKFCGEPGPVDRLLVRSGRFFIGEDFLFPGLEFFFVDGGGVKLLPYFVDFSGELVFASDVSGFFVKVVERNATVSPALGCPGFFVSDTMTVKKPSLPLLKTVSSSMGRDCLL